jgi:hypothetical protein
MSKKVGLNILFIGINRPNFHPAALLENWLETRIVIKERRPQS